MLVAFGLLLPIFLLIAAGYWLRASTFVPETFWGASEKLGYWILLPALVIQAIATRDFSGATAGQTWTARREARGFFLIACMCSENIGLR